MGHAPSELARNGGATIGGGSRHGHLRFSIPKEWQWMPIVEILSYLPDTHVAHTANYSRGFQTAFVDLTCLIYADTRNVRKRLLWWETLLGEMAKFT
jgi:hypothetical protein